jgi:sensor histidine kinase regulating citrate/malate metabolism
MESKSNMESINQPNKPTATTKVQKPRKRRGLIAVVIVLLLLAGIFIWKEMQIRDLKKQQATERQQYQDAATRTVMQAHMDHLRLLVKPYVWAIRAEMMMGNQGQLNLYANDLVQEKNFQHIIVANEQGIVISSTNKKFEGQPFASVGKPAYLSSNTTIVEKMGAQTIVATSPVMGFNTRLGTLLIAYNVPKTNFAVPAKQ